MYRRILPLLTVLAFVAAACSSGGTDPSNGTNALPVGGPDEVIGSVVADGRPAIVNIWASWCGPCRSEAPLLNEAFAEYGDQVHFIGVAVQDTQAGAQAFLAEFGLPFDHFFDQDRRVPGAFGGFGVPITYFLDGDGNVVDTHSGILDEQTLVQGLEDLIAGA